MAYPIARYIVKLIYWPWLKEIKGLENIPKDKPFIIAANHSSYFDIMLPHLCIIKTIDTHILTFVNASYWKIPLVGAFLDWAGGIPVYVRHENGAKKKNMESFKKALDYLKKGGAILIFPEGTRSDDGKLKKAHTGIAKLAIKSKTPILPFGIIDAHRVLPKGAMLPRFRRATRKIMKEIAKLINQKYNY